MPKASLARRFRALSGLFFLPLVISGCATSLSEEDSNILGMCEALDAAYVEQGNHNSDVSGRSDLTRDEAQSLHEESIKLASSISNWSFGLLAAVTNGEGESSAFAQEVDELVDLAWQMDDMIENLKMDNDIGLDYQFKMRSVLGECVERGALIETSSF
jgi:hypothetical protein